MPVTRMNENIICCCVTVKLFVVFDTSQHPVAEECCIFSRMIRLQKMLELSLETSVFTVHALSVLLCLQQSYIYG